MPAHRDTHSKIIYTAVDNIRCLTRGIGSDSTRRGSAPLSHTYLLPRITVLRLCARPASPGLSVRPGLTRPLCWRCIANMMAECWVLTASHAGPVPHAYWRRAGFDQIGAIQASREPSPDLYSEVMIIRPVSRDGIHGPGPLPRLTDVLQSGDHLVSAWPPGETPVESASQCDGAVGLPVPAVEPGISRLTLAGDRASSAGRHAGRRTRSPRFLPIRRQLPSIA